MRSSGEPGGHQATLGWWLTGTAMAVVLVVTVLLLLGVFRRRRGAGDADAGAGREGARGESHERRAAAGLRWIYVGLALTVPVLAGAFAGTMTTLGYSTRVPADALTLEVTGHQWWWEVRYDDARPAESFTTANEIHIPVGHPVRILLRSDDVIHSFWVPELAGKRDLIPGQRNELWLRADRPGTYRGECGEYCGLEHARMAFTVVAEPAGRYAAWAEGQRQENAMASDSLAPAGARVFAERCGSCHTVRGTGAMGRYGPDLTHLASRATIAAGLLTNDPSHLMAWISAAPSLKPGARMPAVSMSADQLRAVVAYLERLR
jgi:cytochrome c oxidase subunit 2